jgi:tyrosine-protein kinase Etk/Wzc
MATIERLSERNADWASEEAGTVDALDLVLILARRRRVIGIATLAAFAAGALIAAVLRPNFTATALIMPPQQESSSAALLSQLGPLASLGGGAAAAMGLKSPADMYIGILGSRTIADAIIHKFGLESAYKLKTMQAARAALQAHTNLESGKDGLIQISVTDHDAKRASDIANAYVAELYDMNSTLAVTEAAQRRVFFDQQLEGEKKLLAAAEENLRATQQKTGIIQLSGQAEMIIRTIAELRAGIASREVELQSTRTFATDQNPDVARLQEEISTMKGQLAKLEDDQQRQAQPGNISVPAGKVPEDSLEYARNLREVKYHEVLLDLLSRQYEAARIDEAKSAPIIQVIDHAVPPDKRSGPHRLLIVLAFGVAGCLFASVWVIFEQGFARLKETPRYASKMHALRALFHN